MLHFGLIGRSLGHSFSKKFFSAKFANEQIDADYELIELDSIDQIDQAIAEHSLSGFNVTIPYKIDVMRYLESMSDEAREIDAVNVVKVTRDADGKPRLIGYNSDVIGFTRSLKPLVEGKHSKALILGTGGVSKAVACSLRRLGIEFMFVSRKAGTGAIAYSDITKEIMESHTLIVNCTPLGMTGHGVDLCPDIPYPMLSDRHLLYDVVYNPEETLFLRKGAEQGAATKSGYEMWYLQALASWEIWNGN